MASPDVVMMTPTPSTTATATNPAAGALAVHDGTSTAAAASVPSPNAMMEEQDVDMDMMEEEEEDVAAAASPDFTSTGNSDAHQLHYGSNGSGHEFASSSEAAIPPPPALAASTSFGYASASSAGSQHHYADQDQQQQQEMIDMGYEECAPSIRQQRRRGSMSHDEEKQRRASIKAIMADPGLSPMAKRRSIQHLMDGRRNSIENRRLSMGSRTSLVSSTGGGAGPFPASRRGSLTASVHSVSSHLSVDPGLFTGGGGGASGSSVPGEPPFGIDVVDMGYGGDDHQLYHDYYPDDNGAATQGMMDQEHVYDEDTMMGHLNLSRMMNFTLCNEQTKRAELNRPQCSHYQRNCTIVAACCGMAFGCRICHDDCPHLPPKINNGGRRYHRSASLPGSFTSMHAGGGGGGVGAGGGPGAAGSSYMMDDMDTSHQIDRFATREVICRECYTRQSSKTNNCVSCGVQFGAYHCNICNLWMSDEEAPYHCAECGFCRVGGAENFQHCSDCGMCIDKTLYDSHHCKAGKYRSNCPVCQEFLFSSRSASHEMPCGHAIHWDCFRQLAAHDSRCPVCKKTAETRDRMMPTWNAMAAGVALQPVPAELARVVNITCNDCEQTEKNRAWHFLGVQCGHCSSFNTVVDRIVLTGEDAHRFLAEQMHQSPNPYNSEAANRPRRRMNRRRSAF